MNKQTGLRSLAAQGVQTSASGKAATGKAHDLQGLKSRIGARAALLVQRCDSLLIDSGTATHCLAHYLKCVPGITVMSNDLDVVCELADAEGVETLSMGSLLTVPAGRLRGAKADSGLGRRQFDKLFLGVDGFDLDFGITTHSARGARLNRQMIACAQQTIVVTDSSKFGRVNLHRIVDLSLVQTLVTDTGISPTYCEWLGNKGIELILVD